MNGEAYDALDRNLAAIRIEQSYTGVVGRRAEFDFAAVADIRCEPEDEVLNESG